MKGLFQSRTLLLIFGLLQLTVAVSALEWTMATLYQPRSRLAATSVGDLALFSGGNAYGTFVATVNIYNARSGQWSMTMLSQARGSLAATSVGDVALFGGGYDSFSDNAYATVDIYNVTSGQWSTATLSQARYDLAATSVGDVALFGGGFSSNGNEYSVVVDIYNVTSGQWSTAMLSQSRYDLAATSVGDVALFGGGVNSTGFGNGNAYATVDIYNVTSGKWSTATLSQARGKLAATSVGDVALFGGGFSSNGVSAVVDIYNVTSGQWSTAMLSVARDRLAATSVGDAAIFGGGDLGFGNYNPILGLGLGGYSAAVDIYKDLAVPSPPTASAGARTSGVIVSTLFLLASLANILS